VEGGGRVLRVVRIANSMTLSNAAAATGLPTNAIREIEAGVVKLGW
jgi:cytoskeletal protein RodZ